MFFLRGMVMLLTWLIDVKRDHVANLTSKLGFFMAKSVAKKLIYWSSHSNNGNCIVLLSFVSEFNSICVLCCKHLTWIWTISIKIRARNEELQSSHWVIQKVKLKSQIKSVSAKEWTKHSCDKQQTIWGDSLHNPVKTSCKSIRKKRGHFVWIVHRINFFVYNWI